MSYFICFFFSSRRRHTRSDRDWSSDVCSSDLQGAAAIDIRGEGAPDDVRLNSNCTIRDFRVAGELAGDFQGQAEWTGKQVRLEGRARGPGGLVRFDEIGRASCRERV